MPVAVLRPFGPRRSVETPIARSHSMPARACRTASAYHILGYLGQRDEPLMDCWGVSNYKSLPIYYQELLSYFSPTYYLSETDIDKLPDELPIAKRELFNDE